MWSPPPPTPGLLLALTRVRPHAYAGAEFDFQFVLAGTTIQLPAFNNPYYLTFLDVDGDLIDTGDGGGNNKAVFELNAVLNVSRLRLWGRTRVGADEEHAGSSVPALILLALGATHGRSMAAAWP